MADIPERRTINPEDFKDEEQEMVSKIAPVINDYTEQMNNAISQNLTISQNFLGELKTITFQAGLTSKTFRYGIESAPAALFVGRVRNLRSSAVTVKEIPTPSDTTVTTGEVAPNDVAAAPNDTTNKLTVPVFAHWSYDGKGNITIESITGLDSNTSYEITFVILSG